MTLAAELFVQCAASGGSFVNALPSDLPFGTMIDRSGRLGKATEMLIAASCILMSEGELSVSTNIVDDEGVDLVFHRHSRPATLAVQVKSRSLTKTPLTKGSFLADLRAQTFQPRDDLYVLYVAVDEQAGDYGPVWLVPSTLLAATVKPNKHEIYRFAASLKSGTRDQWRGFRLSKSELPLRLLQVIEGLERS